MKMQKMISVEREIMDKLESEENVSALIGTLLSEYYLHNMKDSDVLASLNEQEKDILAQADVIKKKKMEVLSNLNLIEKKIEAEDEEEFKRLKKEERKTNRKIELRRRFAEEVPLKDQNMDSWEEYLSKHLNG